MPNVHPSTNSPRSVTEHPSFFNNRRGSMINAGLNSLPGLLPRNSMAFRLPASMNLAQNLPENGSLNESTNGTFIAASRNVNISGQMPNFPAL